MSYVFECSLGISNFTFSKFGFMASSFSELGVSSDALSWTEEGKGRRALDLFF
jgi:hypothetical protein